MAIKPFTVDGNIVVDEATLSNSTNSLVLPAGSIITGGGTVLDATNSDTSDLAEHVDYKYFTDTRARSAISATGDITYDSATGVISFTASAAPVTSVNTQTGAVVLDTDDIAEGTTNLYYTDARADARITASDTDALSEGTTNLYYTDARADARITAADTDALSEGSTNLYYTDARVDTKLAAGVGNITTSGYLRGPANFVIDPAAHGDDTGKVVIAGNLQVDGVQTTINSTIVSIDDLKLSVATDAADSAAANGAGITVGGANANITYTHATTSWDFDKPVNVAGNLGVTGTVDGVDIAARDAILTSTTTTADAALPKAGGTMTGDLKLYKATPIITLQRSDNATLPGLSWQGAGGAEAASIKLDGTSGATNTLIMSTYNGSTMAERLRLMTNAAGGIAVTGTISVTGTVDGVDIAARDAILTSTTTTADAALPKAGGTLTGDLIINTSSNGILKLQEGGADKGYIGAGGGGLYIKNLAGDVIFRNSSDADTIRIKDSGNVGIGTTTPAHKLDVNGAIGVSQVRHSVRPTLNLDFANSKQLDPRITFYRDSIATYYDSKGVLRYANVNEPRFDHDPVTGESKGLLVEEARTNTTPYSQHIISGYSWGVSGVGSFVQSYAGVAPDGTYSASRLFFADANHSIAINNLGAWTVGDTVTTSMWIKGTDGETMRFASGGADFGNVTLTGEWQRVEGTRTSLNTYTNINTYGSATARDVLVWGVQAEVASFATSYIPSDTRFTSRSSAATYHDETGILRTAPANSPRYGYKYDGRKWVETGLILEQGATNKMPQSTGLLAAGWNTSQNTDIADNAGIAPDGSNTASKLDPTNITSVHSTFKMVTSNTNTHCFSFYVKADGENFGYVYVDTVGGHSGYLHINLSTGTVTYDDSSVNNTVAEDYGIENVGNGWYRVWISTALSTGQYYCHINAGNSSDGNTGNWTPTGTTGWLVWGPQLEEGKTVSSFIYNISGTTTRSADVASSTAYTREQDKTYLDNIDNYEWFNQDQGTIYTDITPVDHDPASGTTYFVFNLTDKTIENSITLRYGDIIGGTDVFMKSFNTVEVDLASFTSAAKSQMKAAVAYEQDNAGFSVNGETAKVDTTYRTTNLTYLALSGSETGYFAASHYIKKLSYYPIRLNNAELQALTENN